MDLHLGDTVALVAGSSRGIGRATARAFLAEGSRTVITGRDPVGLADARSALGSEFGHDRLFAYEGDLRDAEIISGLLNTIDQRWGRLDCIVANVGTGRGATG